MFVEYSIQAITPLNQLVDSHHEFWAYVNN